MKKSDNRISLGMRFLLMFLAVAAVWFAICSFTLKKDANHQRRDGTFIIRDILSLYSWNQDLSSERMEKLLKELESVDNDQACRWQKILNCLQESTNDMTLNYGSLPEGLNDSSALCLIILGFQLKPDGSMQDELIGRLETALESAEKYPNAYVLCTGGSTASAAPDITEADAMAQWLMEHGIAEGRIIVENRSRTTSQNAIYSCQILRENYPEITQAAIVSSDYHIPWGKVLFEAQFLLENHPITVVSNAAFHTGKKIGNSTLLCYQLSGIKEIAGIT